MRKLKEGDYFAPKSREEYGFILESLERLGYNIDDLTEDDFEQYPFIGLFDNGLDELDALEEPRENKITLHDLFTEEVETFEPFQKVLVRGDQHDEWEIDFYNSYVSTYKDKHVCFRGDWKYCIDYETNKEKHGRIW